MTGLCAYITSRCITKKTQIWIYLSIKSHNRSEEAARRNHDASVVHHISAWCSGSSHHHSILDPRAEWLSVIQSFSMIQWRVMVQWFDTWFGLVQWFDISTSLGWEMHHIAFFEWSNSSLPTPTGLFYEGALRGDWVRWCTSCFLPVVSGLHRHWAVQMFGGMRNKWYSHRSAFWSPYVMAVFGRYLECSLRCLSKFRLRWWLEGKVDMCLVQVGKNQQDEKSSRRQNFSFTGWFSFFLGISSLSHRTTGCSCYGLASVFVSFCCSDSTESPWFQLNLGGFSYPV